MNLLMVGGDGRGSWQMRGVQMGAALGARVTTRPTASDWAWADMVVLVKRAAFAWADVVRDLRVPVIWDVLDFWAQPEDNGRHEADLVDQVQRTRDTLGIDRVIGATQRMADAIHGDYLPHHCRIGLTPTPPRDHASVVGYDGQAKYLGTWKAALERACGRLGLTFVVNPPDLSAVDVLVSFRDGRWDGWVCREWKSGVKYVNALCAGRPVLSQPTAAFTELQPVGELVTHQVDLEAALAAVTSPEVRARAYRVAQHWAAEFTVEAIARQYGDLIARTLAVAA